MDIYAVDRMIEKMAGGFEKACLDQLRADAPKFKTIIQEQLYSGLDGDGRYLSPTYDNDPFFDRVRWYHYENGKVYHGAEGYKQWKLDITPPKGSDLIGLPPRPEDVPNLFIDGTFYDTIVARESGDGVNVSSESENGRDIEQKYGSQIFGMADQSAAWYNETYMKPAIQRFFEDCGYR